jgi:outer membrane lipoprotein-sorting protein
MKAKINQMNMELPMVMKVKRPNKFRMEMTLQGQEMVQAYDGENGWMVAPWMSMEPQDLVGDQLKQAMEQADIDGALWNYKDKGHSAELVGKEDMEGTEVYNIKLTKKEGDVQNYYVDTETFILLKIKSKIMAQGTEVEVESMFGNYKQFDNGIVMPMSIEQKTSMGSATIVIEEVEFGVELDDAIFTRPKSE